MRRRPQISERDFDKWAGDIGTWIRESVSPFENDTPEKQRERVERAEHDLCFFIETYLPHYAFADFGDFHREWDGLSQIRDELVLVAAAREHAKTTFFSFAIPIRHICYKKHKFQIIVSKTDVLVTRMTLPIKLELEANPRIKYDFGTQHVRGSSLPWQHDFFVCENGCGLQGVSRGQDVRGLKLYEERPGYASIDDYDNKKSVKNSEIVDEGITWIRGDLLGAMKKGFTAVFVGNLFDSRCVLSRMIAMKEPNGKPTYISKIYPAWLDYGTPNQRPLWAANWSAERLEKRQQQMGSVIFFAEFMHISEDSDTPFPRKWFRYYQPEDIAGKKLKTASFTDPSAKDGESNDFKSIITVGLDESEMRFYVRHATIRHLSITGMFAAAYRQHDEYGGDMGIEENMLKDFLHSAIQTYAKEVKRYIPWKSVDHRANKEARIIGTLSHLVEYGRLLFMQGHSDQDILVEQLVHLLNKNVHDDGPDALEGAVSLLQKIRSQEPFSVMCGGAREADAIFDKFGVEYGDYAGY